MDGCTPRLTGRTTRRRGRLVRSERVYEPPTPSFSWDIIIRDSLLHIAWPMSLSADTGPRHCDSGNVKLSKALNRKLQRMTLITDAISALDDVTGSTQGDLTKYVADDCAITTTQSRKHVRIALKRCLDKHLISVKKGRYRILSHNQRAAAAQRARKPRKVYAVLPPDALLQANTRRDVRRRDPLPTPRGACRGTAHQASGVAAATSRKDAVACGSKVDDSEDDASDVDDAMDGARDVDDAMDDASDMDDSEDGADDDSDEEGEEDCSDEEENHSSEEDDDDGSEVFEDDWTDEDEVASSDGDEVVPCDVVEVASSDEDEVARPDPDKVASSGEDKDAPTEVDKNARSDVEEVASSDLDKDASSDLDKDAGSDLDKDASSGCPDEDNAGDED